MKQIKLKNMLSENTPGYKDREFGAPLPTLEDVQNAHNAKQNLKEDRFGHPITALGNQIYIQLDKMEDMLTGKEKSFFKGSRKTFWDKAKKAMEAEEQK